MPAAPPSKVLPPEVLPPEMQPEADPRLFSDEAAYQALSTRDARFDGRFFVGVSSTGIYCRPVCRVRLPKRENCRFFSNAASAEQAGFRPCLRCRPELAPGLSLNDSSQALAQAGARQIELAVAAGQAPDLPGMAAALGVTERHFRRIFRQAHGVSPMQWVSTRRLLLAKALLTDTSLPITEVAGASGFASLRRFHAAWAQHYRLAPGALRRSAGLPAQGAPSAEPPKLTLSDPLTAPLSEPAGSAHIRLPWRPPYDAEAMQRFLAQRPLPGVEALLPDGTWLRTLALNHASQAGQRFQGWLALKFEPERNQACLEISAGLVPALGLVLARVRHWLDLDADPATIASALQGLPQPLRPGLRVPGTLDGFETTVRIILGQQVSVAAACTLAGRLVARFGEPVQDMKAMAMPCAALSHFFPTPEALAGASAQDIGTLGIVRSRVAALQALARAVASGELALHPAAPLAPTLARLRALPGIGEWTCELVALRVLAWPDAFPAGDAGVIRALGGLRAPASLQLAERWRPWRAYAVMQLWQT